MGITFGASTPLELEMKSTWLAPSATVSGTTSTDGLSLGALGADAANPTKASNVNGISDVNIILGDFLNASSNDISESEMSCLVQIL